MLIIREHPSTFSRGTDWKSRWPGFYKDFEKIGAKFVNFDSDPYSLMDDSLCVFSVGGNIVAEAIFRGKPAVYFGMGASYPIDKAPLHKYRDLKSLKEFISNCENYDSNDFKNTELSLRDLLDKYTVSADLEHDYKIDDLFVNSFRLKAIMKYLNLMLS